MDRRAALRLLGASAAVAAVPEDLAALGRSLHRTLGPATDLKTLNQHQNATVVALTDIILPATDTPGAKAARVNEFIDVLLTDWFDPPDRDRFLAGLADVDARAHAAFGKDFVDGTPEQQTAIVQSLDDEATRWKASPPSTPEGGRGPDPFSRELKWLTLFGYYTSEIGALQEQHYEIIPNRYGPCEPVHGSSRPS